MPMHKQCRGCASHRRVVGYHVPADRPMTEVDRQHQPDWALRPQPVYAHVTVVTRHGIGGRAPIASTKQPGRRYGPAPKAPTARPPAAPKGTALRLVAYSRQVGGGAITDRQARRANKKMHRLTKGQTTA